MKGTGGRKPRAARIVLAAVFAAAVALFFALGGDEYASFEALKAGRQTLLSCTERHYAATLASALLLFTAATAFSVPVATVLSLAIGLMFGRWIGVAVIVVSGTLGATLLLIAARYVFTDWLARRTSSRVARFDASFRHNAFLYVAFLRVVPVFPFWLVNLAAAATSIRATTYAAATAVGMVPISFVWASLGESLARIESPEDAVSATTIAALTALGLLGLAAVFLKGRMAGKGSR